MTRLRFIVTSVTGYSGDGGEGAKLATTYQVLEYVTRERWPRSRWLHDFEAVLREHYPQATSKQRTLTARLAAPFTLARPGVP